MQKLSGIGSGKNNKSCRIIHNGSNKIGFAVFRFFSILYAIYKKQPKHFTIGVTLLQGGTTATGGATGFRPGGAMGGRSGF
jgi:hypothetical protein